MSIDRTKDNSILLSSRFKDLQRRENLGLLSEGEIKLSLNQIKAAILSVAGDVRTWPAQVPIPASQPSPSMNKVALVKNVFKAVKEDLENLSYSKNAILGYISSLNTAFESRIFSAFSDPIYRSDWEEMNSAQQKELCKKVLETLSKNEEKIVERMVQFQSKLNGTVSLDESIQSFFNSPSIKSWNELSEQLTNRFSDTSLFGEKVIHAFNGWKTKLNNLDDELSFSMDFNFDYRTDFGSFLKANLSPKNFNY